MTNEKRVDIDGLIKEINSNEETGFLARRLGSAVTVYEVTVPVEEIGEFQFNPMSHIINPADYGYEFDRTEWKEMNENGRGNVKVIFFPLP